MSAIDKVEQYLKSDVTHWAGVLRVDARVPIVRAYFKNFHLECDLTVNNVLAVCNTELINYFFQLQPLCTYCAVRATAKTHTIFIIVRGVFVAGHRITAFVKIWASHGKFDISGYALTLLVIFYFQTKCLLPPVEKLLPDKLKNPNKSQCKVL